MRTPTRLAILGATGSIGRQAIEVARAHPDRLKIVALGGFKHPEALADLGRELGIQCTALDPDGMLALATSPDVDLVLVATPGFAGLVPTVAALKAGKSVALANKEVLVVAGHLVRELSGGAGERLRPIDSEHSALWQCLLGERREDVARIALTASGGAFRNLPLADLASVTPEQALRHPTWRMGPKVTVDSATLVNKGYEVVEAHWLYQIPYDQIDVVLHPESVVHAMVEMTDGSVKAQLAEPDMRLAIQFGLLWEHTACPAPRFDWLAQRSLTFGAIEPSRYPCFEIVLEVARSGDHAAMVGLSAADEVAVELFLSGELPFGGIPRLLKQGAEHGSALGRGQVPELAEIIAIDTSVREALSSAVTTA